MDSLKNKVLRDVQVIKRKLGKTETLTDEQYKELYQRIEQQNTVVANFSKHLNQLVESYHHQASLLHFLADDIRDVYIGDVDKEQRDLAEKMMRIADECENSCVLPLSDTLKNQVISVTDQHLQKFPAMKEHNKRRKNKLLEFEYQRDKVKSLEAKPNPKKPEELPKQREKLDELRQQYEDMDSTAKSSMTDLLEQRTEVFDPAVSTMLLQLVECHQKQAQVLVQLVQDARHLQISGGKRSGVAFISEGMSGMDLSSPTGSTMSVSSTSSIGNAGAGRPALPPAAASAAAAVGSPVPVDYNCEWFYLDGQVQQQGPFDPKQMKLKYKRGEITPATHVFGGEMPDWAQIKDVARFRQWLESV